MRLLIIDDDEILLRSLARLFRGYGWDVMTVDSAEKIHLAFEFTDVVLCDWNPMGALVLANSPLPVAIISGDIDRAIEEMPHEAKRPIGVYQKPVIDFGALNDALWAAATRTKERTA